MKKDAKMPLAIVTGGSGYVGGAIVNVLKKNGWRVAVLSRTKAGEDTYTCDITDEAAVANVIEKIVKSNGTIRACIHAAAAQIENRPLADISQRSYDKAMTVAARGAFLLAKSALPHMQAGAAFIGITSALIEPRITLMPMGAYIPSKMALRGFLRALASDTRERKIRVFAVAPGFIAGGLNRNVPHAILKMFATKTGAGQTSAEEVARVIKNICTDIAAYPPSSSIGIPGKVTAL